MPRIAVASVALFAACARSSEPPASAAANFVLSCHSASTATSRAMHCIRTDSRTGDISRVDMTKLTVSNGPTASAPGPAGRYQTACATAASTDQADFYCVRLNSETGELLLVNLTKLGQVP